MLYLMFYINNINLTKLMLTQLVDLFISNIQLICIVDFDNFYQIKAKSNKKNIRQKGVYCLLF